VYDFDMGKKIDGLTFNEDIGGKDMYRPLSKERRVKAQNYLERALSMAAPSAIEFQVSLLNDETADKRLRFMASESLIDRFAGKAAQVVRVGETEERPIIFDSKLRTLQEAMKVATDVRSRELGDTPGEAFARAVTGYMDDGVII